jgi:hypothetical protein
METNEIIIAAIISIVLGLFVTFIAARNAEEIKEDESPSKFEPRKITDLSSEQPPKRRHYKKNYKKKPTNAKNAQVDKKPVGRPRKSE